MNLKIPERSRKIFVNTMIESHMKVEEALAT
jgi:hypothetical protein